MVYLTPVLIPTIGSSRIQPARFLFFFFLLESYEKTLGKVRFISIR
jgi:hypothetical protein